MAKHRFRDIKQGKIKVQTPKNNKKDQAQTHLFPDKRTRSKAFITDSFMLLMPLMYIVFYLVMGSRESFAANKLLGWVYILVPLIFVQISFLVKASQTPGMRAYNIKVVDVGTLGPPSFGQIVIRQITAPFSRLLFGWVLMFLRPDHRQPHELLSGTALVNTEDPLSNKPKT